MQTERRPLYQYVLFALIAAGAYLLVPGTDVSWSAEPVALDAVHGILTAAG